MLVGHAVSIAEDLGWDRLTNGHLLDAAERAGFELLLTADKSIRYQQNLSGRKTSLVVLGNSPWKLVRLHIAEIVAARECGDGRQLCRGGNPPPAKEAVRTALG